MYVHIYRIISHHRSQNGIRHWLFFQTYCVWMENSGDVAYNGYLKLPKKIGARESAVSFFYPEWVGIGFRTLFFLFLEYQKIVRWHLRSRSKSMWNVTAFLQLIRWQRFKCDQKFQSNVSSNCNLHLRITYLALKKADQMGWIGYPTIRVHHNAALSGFLLPMEIFDMSLVRVIAMDIDEALKLCSCSPVSHDPKHLLAFPPISHVAHADFIANDHYYYVVVLFRTNSKPTHTHMLPDQYQTTNNKVI